MAALATCEKSTITNKSTRNGALNPKPNFVHLNLGSRRPYRGFLKHQLPTSHLRWRLILIGFTTGLLDVATYADMGVFASNQTGNTVLLMFAIVGGPGGERIPLVQTAVSLCVFLFAGLLSGQLAHLWPGGPRSRSFLFLAGLVQSLPLFVPAALLQTGGWTLLDDRTRHGGSDAWKVLVFLAGTSGIQVSCARLSGCQEIPTAMLTSPWIDLLADRQLFAPKLRGKEVMPRNLRAAYIAVFVLGSLVGGFMNRYSSSANVIYLTAAIKVATALSFLADRVGDTTRLPT